MCVCVCVCVYMCVCVCVCVCVGRLVVGLLVLWLINPSRLFHAKSCFPLSLSLSLSLSLYIYVCVYIYICIYIYVCVCVSVCVCVCVSVCVCWLLHTLHSLNLLNWSLTIRCSFLVIYRTLVGWGRSCPSAEIQRRILQHLLPVNWALFVMITRL